MSELRIRLMYDHAADLMAAAKVLRRQVYSAAPAYLLDLTAFEILLKTCIAIETGVLERGHDYATLFSKLNLDTRATLTGNAAGREGPVADFSDVGPLLRLWQRNFVQLRYPYEPYEGFTEEQYLQLGPTWIDRGAKVEEATFDLRPNELHGMLFALSEFACTWLAQQDASYLG